MNYPVIGQVKSKTGAIYPVFDIPMMSDERWQELARENAVQNFIMINGYEPESIETAIKWQRERIEQRKIV